MLELGQPKEMRLDIYLSRNREIPDSQLFKLKNLSLFVLSCIDHVYSNFAKAVTQVEKCVTDLKIIFTFAR